MNTPNPTAAPVDATRLSEQAQQEIIRIFNSLTNSQATVSEYVAYEYPDTGSWSGDTCGCTDDRCIGFHHEANEPCGCLERQLDEFHDDLTVANRIREWLVSHREPALARSALEVLRDNPQDFPSRLDPAQQAVIAALFASATYLDPADFSRALYRLRIDAPPAAQ